MPSPKTSSIEQSNLRELQRFLDATVHSLRSPLLGISTSATLLAGRCQDPRDEQVVAHLQSVSDGIKRLDKLSKSLSDYSMALLPEGAAHVSLPATYALEGAKAFLRQEILECQASIHCDSLPSVSANHELLRVLFRCLLSNALEYRRCASPSIEVTATKCGGEWRFSVHDDGVGIPAQYQRQVFEPFQRLHSGRVGVGLGLTIATKIVEGHGGRIWLESVEGQGTTVYFTWPEEFAD